MNTRIDRVLVRGSAAVGQNTVAPRTGATQPGAEGRVERTGADVATDVETVNPAAAELSFTPASEARDVAARLERYARRFGAPVGEADGMSGGPGVDGAEPGAGRDPAADLGPPTLELTLPEALRTFQRSSREFRSAEEEYILTAIRLLIERHLWGPRFFNDTTVQIAGDGDDGRFDHALSVINTLRATKRLPYGGSVEAAWVFDATEQLREQATGRYRQSSEIALSGNLPLLRGAGLVAREDLIQSERNTIYAARSFERFRRRLLVDIANDYFQLLQTKARIVNQERQLASLQQLQRATAALVEAGRREAFEESITANRVLSGIASLSSLREQYILQLERFKIRLGLPLDQPIDISDAIIEIPEPEIDLDLATQLALEYRLDLQNARDRIGDARRGVANARNDLLPDLDVNARVGVPTDPDAREGGLNFSGEDLNYSAGVTLSLPLDREIERLQLKSSMIRLEQQVRDYEQQRDNVIVDVRSALRNVDLARFQLTLAEQQVEINRRRLRGQRLRADLLDPQTLVDTENDLLDAENQRDQALTQLRNAVLNYLLASDQLRVERDGSFLPLPGMGGEAIDAELELPGDAPDPAPLP